MINNQFSKQCRDILNSIFEKDFYEMPDDSRYMDVATIPPQPTLESKIDSYWQKTFKRHFPTENEE